MADAETTAGALLGTSTVTTYVESATGVSEGGRTGLTSFVVAILFGLSIFLSPVSWHSQFCHSTGTYYCRFLHDKFYTKN